MRVADPDGVNPDLTLEKKSFPVPTIVHSTHGSDKKKKNPDPIPNFNMKVNIMEISLLNFKFGK